MWIPSSAEISRADRMTAACSGGFPCEKFRRSTFTPLKKSDRSVAGSCDAGPTVATIFVRFLMSASINGTALCPGVGRLLRSVKRT